ncbi:unnamed protein product, partial [Phaeothamnion confervicola]
MELPLNDRIDQLDRQVQRSWQQAEELEAQRGRLEEETRALETAELAARRELLALQGRCIAKEAVAAEAEAETAALAELSAALSAELWRVDGTATAAAAAVDARRDDLALHAAEQGAFVRWLGDRDAALQRQVVATSAAAARHRQQARHAAEAAAGLTAQASRDSG